MTTNLTVRVHHRATGIPTPAVIPGGGAVITPTVIPGGGAARRRRPGIFFLYRP